MGRVSTHWKTTIDQQRGGRDTTRKPGPVRAPHSQKGPSTAMLGPLFWRGARSPRPEITPSRNDSNLAPLPPLVQPQDDFLQQYKIIPILRLTACAAFAAASSGAAPRLRSGPAQVADVRVDRAVGQSTLEPPTPPNHTPTQVPEKGYRYFLVLTKSLSGPRRGLLCSGPGLLARSSQPSVQGLVIWVAFHCHPLDHFLGDALPGWFHPPPLAEISVFLQVFKDKGQLVVIKIPGPARLKELPIACLTLVFVPRLRSLRWLWRGSDHYLLRSDVFFVTFSCQVSHRVIPGCHGGFGQTLPHPVN